MQERDFDDAYQEDVTELVSYYESMVRDNSNYFLEEGSFDQLIEYYEEKQQRNRALEVADRAIEQHPFSASFLVRKAQILFDSKEFDQAMDLLDKAEVLDATDTNIFLLRSDIYLWMGKYTKAVSTINQALAVAETEEIPDLYLELADIYEEWEKYDEVFDCLVRTLELDPENEEGLNRIWFCIEFTEKYQESIEFHSRFIDEHPYSHLAWFNLAHAYAGLGMYEKAVEAFEFVMAINDNYEYAYKDCGEILFKMGDFTKASEYLIRASIIAKPYKELYYSLGECHEKMGDHNRARYYFRKATNLDPYFDEAYFKIGINYEIENRWDNALSSYERAYKLDNENLGYIIALAHAYQENAIFDKAIEMFQKAVEMQPDDKDNWLDLSRAQFEVGDFREAFATLDMAAISFKDNADIFYTKSAYYYTAGNKSESYVNLERALLLKFKDHRIVFELNPVMESDNEVLKVIDVYRK